MALLVIRVRTLVHWHIVTKYGHLFNETTYRRRRGQIWQSARRLSVPLPFRSDPIRSVPFRSGAGDAAQAWPGLAAAYGLNPESALWAII